MGDIALDNFVRVVCLEDCEEECTKRGPSWCMSAKADYAPNGFTIKCHVVPEELLIWLLCYVDTKSLLNCRLVCYAWKEIVDSQIWRYKLKRNVYRRLKTLYGCKLKFNDFFFLYIHDPFNRNLIKNPSGEESLNEWHIVKNGGDGWAVENPPQYSEPLPQVDDDNTTNYFVTSYWHCYKEQEINLTEFGFAPYIFDALKPTIHVYEWFAGHVNCACVYEMRVELLDKEKQLLDRIDFQKGEEEEFGSKWQKVSHDFKYKKGTRYIKFAHGGQDRQFWKGHYGSKMRSACVKLIL